MYKSTFSWVTVTIRSRFLLPNCKRHFRCCLVNKVLLQVILVNLHELFFGMKENVTVTGIVLPATLDSSLRAPPMWGNRMNIPTLV